MSYAEVAASGPPQSAEDARATPVPEIIPTDHSVGSLIDVDTGISVVPHDFEEQEVKTGTQAARLDREAEAEEERLAIQVETEAKARVAARKEANKDKAACKDYARSPIVLVNGALGVIFAVAMGYAGYKKHASGQLTWKLAAIWGAGIAAAAGVDYTISTWLVENYPQASGKKE